jgi:cell division protein FtsW
MTRRPSTLALQPDMALIILGVALAAVGLVAISSAGMDYGARHYGNPWHLALRHGFYLMLATTAGLLAYLMPTDFWRRSSPWWLLGATALLLLVLIPGIGRNINGSQRWLPLGPLTLQPSEVVKLAMLLYVAGYLVRHGELLRQHWSGLAKPIAILAVIGSLLLSEPDFGATVIVVGTVFGLLFIAGARLIYVAGLIGAALAGMVLLVLAAPYRMRRLTAYRDPWEDPFGDGFQLTQSLIAIGRGEWFGVGLGNSIQKLFYLPLAHTDFVFSIWAEETGFVGALVVIGLFVALVTRIIQVGIRALRHGDEFAAYVCFGVSLVFSGQVFVNIGMSSGLLPTKGLTLPFISYGGSSLLVSAVMLALVLRIERTIPRSAGGGQ